MPFHSGVIASSVVYYYTFIFAGSISTPYLHGAGYVYNTVQTAFASPVTVVEGSVRTVSTNLSKTNVAIGLAVTPWIGAYTYTGSGWGTRFANPATLPTGTARGVRWDGNSNVILGHFVAPFVTAYAWSSGFGTKFANPSPSLPAQALYVTLNPTRNVVSISLNSGTIPFTSYVWSSSTGFGTKFADPATIGASTFSINFSPAGDAVVTNGNAGINAWKWSAGVGTKYTQPAVTGGAGGEASFNPAGNTVFTTLNSATSMAAWEWTFASGFGTKYADPVMGLFSNPDNGQFNNAGNTIAIAWGQTIGFWPFVAGTGFGTKYASEFTPSTGSVSDVEFN